MFSYTGLTPSQVYALKEKYHIYLLKSGRASISGLSKKNVAYVAQAINDVVRNVN
jgi:aspartate aminotransferase